ncbi:V-type proton ATPase subunit D [Venturia nashicola]|uniref:V-type proton ATPase subunit D n=1 Tax=Venturia nashicola TaxID=86259 RepID=A0A4Z1P9B9_9PEZI|nr:V-type proton ATPase subunit D [Venturia nashicola]TLD37927.1 V-type proton ATPase subunit D [Venturia nashicola]
MASQSTQPTKILRANGNLTLIVGKQKQRILVSRDVVMGICKPWEAMLTRFIEASQAEVELPDDDPTAVTIVCTIAHLRFHDLPLTLTIDELSKLATLCDKYDTTAIVGPFIHARLTPWFYDPVSKPEQKYLDNGNEKFIWIAWVFGYESEFYTLTDAIRRRISVDEKGQCVCNGGRVVLDDMQMPPEIAGESSASSYGDYQATDMCNTTENLFDIRNNCIRDLLEICYSYINKVSDGEMVCKATSTATAKQEECFAITFGSCLWGFRSTGLSKPEKTSTDVHESINEFWEKLSALKIHSLPERGRYSDIHSQCNFEVEMKGKLRKVMQNMPSAYHNSHKERIRENWRRRIGYMA